MGGHEHLNFVASYMLMSMYLNFSAYVFAANYVIYALYETMCELLGETYWYYLSMDILVFYLSMVLSIGIIYGILSIWQRL